MNIYHEKLQRSIPVYYDFLKRFGKSRTLEVLDRYVTESVPNRAIKNFLFNEYSISDILSSVDSDFINHADHLGVLKGASVPELKKTFGFSVLFETGSSGEYAATKGNVYQQKIKFMDLFSFMRDRQIRLSEFDEAFDLIFEEGDIHVNCSCPAHKFYGYRYITGQLDFAYGKATRKAPDVRNPDRRGSVCKHLAYVLEAMPNFKNYIKHEFKTIIQRKGKRTGGEVLV